MWWLRFWEDFWRSRKTIEVGDIQSFIQYVRTFYTADPADRTGCEHAADDGGGVRESV